MRSALDGRDEAALELVVDRVVDVHPLDVHAHLAGVAEDRLDDTREDLVQVDVVEHDHRVLAAELEAGADEVLSRALPDEATGLGGAGEHHVVGVVDHRRSGDGTLAAHHLEQPLGQAGLVEQVHAVQRGQRRLVVGLEHHAVAGHQCGDRVGDARREREVPGRDDPDDALGLVDLGRRADHGHGSGALDGLEQLGRALEVVRHDHHRVARLLERHPAGLAALRLDEVDDRLVVLDEQLVEAPEHREPLLHGPLRPLGLGAPGGGVGPGDVVGARLRQRGDHLAGVDLLQLPGVAARGCDATGQRRQQVVGDGCGQRHALSSSSVLLARLTRAS